MNEAQTKYDLIDPALKKAKIGNLGEIYWEGIGTMGQLDGSLTPCNYDMSPEFVYENSVFLDKAFKGELV